MVSEIGANWMCAQVESDDGRALKRVEKDSQTDMHSSNMSRKERKHITRNTEHMMSYFRLINEANADNDKWIMSPIATMFVLICNKCKEIQLQAFYHLFTRVKNNAENSFTSPCQQHQRCWPSSTVCLCHFTCVSLLCVCLCMYICVFM